MEEVRARHIFPFAMVVAMYTFNVPELTEIMHGIMCFYMIYMFAKEEVFFMFVTTIIYAGFYINLNVYNNMIHTIINTLIYVGYFFSLSYLRIMRNKAEKETTRLKKREKKDYLTKLYNRKYFDEQVKSFFKKDSILMFIEIDFFKEINDMYGSNVGDQIIKEITTIMTDLIGKDDLVFRYGGKEFAMLMSRSENDHLEIAEEIRMIIESTTIIHRDVELNVTVSIGISGSQNAKNIGDFIEIADAALCSARKSGRNTVISYEDVVI